MTTPIYHNDVHWLNEHTVLTYYLFIIHKYEASSENKERLRIQPAQLFHCTRSVIWCVQ